MPARSRFRWSLVAAVAAHAVLTWQVRQPRSPGANVAPSTAHPTELAIEIERPEPVRVDARGVVEPPAPPLPHATTQAHADPRASILAAQPSPQASGAPDAPPPPTGGADDGTWTISPTGSAQAGSALSPEGLARAERAGIGAMLAQEERAEARRPPRKLFTPHDLALGLVPGGQFVTVTRDAVRTSLVPDVGRALLELDTNAAGMVVSVRVLEVSSGRAAWEEIAASLVRDAGTRPREKVPAGASGVAMVLEITSALKTVSGATPEGNALKSIWGAVNSPSEALVDAQHPLRRIVAVHIVDVRAL